MLRAGLEPARISPHAPQTCAATNYATSAILNFQKRDANYFFVFVSFFGVFAALFVVVAVFAALLAVFDDVLVAVFVLPVELKSVVGG